MQIKFLIMDVDGTLTDGKVYIGQNGELFKAFNIKDGCGIKDILPQYGIVPIIITARESDILKWRCEELNITMLYQGIINKFDKLKDIISTYNKLNDKKYLLKNCAYIGDDIIDLKCMNRIKEAGGIVGCPKDAVKDVLEISDYVSTYNGGEGSVRDFIEWIITDYNDK